MSNERSEFAVPILSPTNREAFISDERKFQMRSFSFFLVARASSNPFLLILSIDKFNLFCDFVSLISDGCGRT